MTTIPVQCPTLSVEIRGRSMIGPLTDHDQIEIREGQIMGEVLFQSAIWYQNAGKVTVIVRSPRDSP